MTHRRALLVSLACAVLFAAGYSLLAPQGARGWGSVEIADIRTEQRVDRGVDIVITIRLPGVSLGMTYRLGFLIISEQCGYDAELASGQLVKYGLGERVERILLPSPCAADDYELTVGLFDLTRQEIARDTMRFSVPASP